MSVFSCRVLSKYISPDNLTVSAYLVRGGEPPNHLTFACSYVQTLPQVGFCLSRAHTSHSRTRRPPPLPVYTLAQLWLHACLTQTT